MPGILRSLKECAEAEETSQTSILVSSYVQTHRDFFRLAIDAFSFRGWDSLKLHDGTDADRVAVAFSGLMTHPSLMVPLLQNAQEECSCDVIAYPHRMPLSVRKRQRVLAWGLDQVQEQKEAGRNVVAVGFSAGGGIAHVIGARQDVPSLSVFTPQNSNQSPLGMALKVFRRTPFRPVILPKRGHAIIEAFSPMCIGGTFEDHPDQVTTAKGVHNHLGINHEETRRLFRTLLKAMFESQEKE
jgi:hypothetical protein